ncbi:MAG: thermonuclease family protein [Sterolibacteriaceae bacterium]|uniref:Thermonuclease family protein n=1 Tax=Candidatus Methylophosphatis roskildensis TaxID=2899263 RepID=A0A9D7DYC0_9PROT|nr:thermonuclease family protein [Candidatus Methylophosphatis roskildensis]MBK7237513.1 thermonuclease family protein [Sterolibacteriaceae bacterium]
MIRFLAAILLAAVAHCAAADTLTGRVVSIADGDTITVLDTANTQYKIRLSGVDAPEKGQPYGRVSRQRLADSVFTKTVQVEWDKRDRYGRIVGKVIADGRDVCLSQIEAGLAWHYKKYEMEQPVADRRAYADAEVRARDQKRGLWMDAHPVPPWEWRRAARSN